MGRTRSNRFSKNVAEVAEKQKDVVEEEDAAEAERVAEEVIL